MLNSEAAVIRGQEIVLSAVGLYLVAAAEVSPQKTSSGCERGQDERLQNLLLLVHFLKHLQRSGVVSSAAPQQLTEFNKQAFSSKGSLIRKKTENQNICESGMSGWCEDIYGGEDTDSWQTEKCQFFLFLNLFHRH